MQVAPRVADAPPPLPPSPDALLAMLRGLPFFAQASDHALQWLVANQLITSVELPRDTLVLPPEHLVDPLCIVAIGQISIGVFDREDLAERSKPQRDAALGEQDGTLLPPAPLARSASKNLALFAEGEVFNLGAIPTSPDDEDVTAAFSLTRAVVVIVGADPVRQLVMRERAVEGPIAAALAHTDARLRAITGIKHDILDFYVRNGLSVAGPSVRLRQLDLCIDCKQCEDACEERHGARRLTLGGFELGLLDFVYTCRTCTDARCLSPCEHDAIKRDARTGEVQIVEDRCIGCSLCALSCPYGAIDMVNVAEPESPTHNPQFKARLDKSGKLAFGPGKGRKAPARRIANKCDHCSGHADQACVSACPTGALIEVSPSALFRERGDAIGGRRKRLVVLPTTPFVEGINIRDSGMARVTTRKLSTLIWILGMGAFLTVFVEVALRWWWPKYSVSYRLLVLDGLEPEIAVLNVSYLAGSKLALTCGYLGTALMVLSMAYPLQRRFKWFYKTATNQFWLDVHLMTGFVGPLFILLHSALRLTTWVSVPFWSMVAVVSSGVIGRYLYTLVPAMTNRHELAILEHRRAITELAREYELAAEYANTAIENEARYSGDMWSVGLLTVLPWILYDDLRRAWARHRDRRALRALAPRKVANAIARRLDRIIFYERRAQLAPRGKALLKAWKRVHIPFSLVLLVTMLVHIAIALEL